MKKTLDKLYSYNSFGIKLGLENIKKLVKAFDYEKGNMKIIHIAGTNGKGSVASILESVLIHKGYSVGKYTSPHLIDFNERIVVNKKMISDSEIVAYFTLVEKRLEELEMQSTFFEITTMMMFLYMKDKNVDYLVMETGLGGRFDATNVLDSDIAVITNISNDHSQYLGETLAEISYEKSGIIKNKQIAFLGSMQEELLREVKKKTEDYILALDEAYKIELNDNFETIIKIDNNSFKLPLYGKFQGENFILAKKILNYFNIDNETIRKGIRSVVWPGRFEIYSKEPLLVLDGAHNEDAAEKLKENLIEKYNKDDVVLVSSMLKDKEVESVYKIFSEFTETVIFTSLKKHIRGMSEDENALIGEKYFKNIIKRKDIKSAYEEAIKMNKKIIVIAGSLYLIGDFKKEV